MSPLPFAYALGVKAPLNFSVFSTSAGAFLLAASAQFPYGLDAFRHVKG